MEATVFDNKIIQILPLYPNCLGTLQDVSNRDYSGLYKFDDRIECLDLDRYEGMVGGGNPDKTVDAVIGICTCSSDKRMTDHRLLLIELRLKYKSTNHLSVESLLGKVRHSKDLLGSEMKIDKTSLFIFNEKVSEQAKRWFSNRRNEGGGEFRNFRACSVEDFNNNVHSYEDLPYKPKHSSESVKEDILRHMNENIGEMIKSLAYWLKACGGYKYSNPLEYESLKGVLGELLIQIVDSSIEMSEDEKIDFEILKEDYINYL